MTLVGRRSAFFLLACVLLTSLAFGDIAISPSATGNDSAGHGYSPGGLHGTFLTVNWDTSEANIGLVQFDLSAYAGVTSATLELYHLFNPAAGAQFGIFQNTSPWVGVTTDWASRPSTSSGPTLQIGAGDAVWRSVDVTTSVQSWLSGGLPNYGFTIERLDQANPVVYFTSRDGFYDCCGATPPGYDVYAPRLVLGGVSTVPEPASVVLLGTVVLGVIMTLRRRSTESGK